MKAKTYTQKEVDEMVIRARIYERSRAKDIADYYRDDNMQSYESKMKAGYELAFINKRVSEECRYLGNAISGGNALSNETMEERIRREHFEKPIERISKETYNKEIDDAVERVRNGESVSNDDVMKELDEICDSKKHSKSKDVIDTLYNSQRYSEGDVVIAKFGYNTVLKKPFEFLYEFGYYTKNGCVVYKKGERNMQDSRAFKLEQIRFATDSDMKKYFWGN